MGRLSPIVFAQHATKFLRAAKREAHAEPQDVSMPAYFLVARAIELSLKTYLLTLGRDRKALRRISHDLGRALDEALAAGLRGVTSFSPAEEQYVRWINEYCWRKELEYPTTGFYSFPPIAMLTDFTERLLRDLEPRTREWGLALARKPRSRSDS